MARKPLIISIIIIVVISTILWSRWRPAKRFEYEVVAEAQLRVMTWNVGYFAVVSNKNLRDVDLESISNLITESGADVVVLQELSTINQAQIIAESLGESWSEYSTSTGHGKQTLTILSRYKSIEHDVMECGGRNVVTTSFISSGNVSINIVGVHSPHPARGLEATKSNIQCALDLSDTKEESVRIVTGDMNYDFDPDDSNSEFYQDIMATYGDGTKYLGETYYLRTRIDHMFHFPKTLSVDKSSSGLLDLPLRFTKVPGFRDHRPIVVTYNLSM